MEHNHDGDGMSECGQCEAKNLFQSDIASLKTDYSWIKQAIVAIQESTKEIASSSKAMVRLEMESNETRQALSRAFIALEKEEIERVKSDALLAQKVDAGFDKIDGRLESMEREMPTVLLARTCVFSVIAMALTNFAGIIWLLIR